MYLGDLSLERIQKFLPDGTFLSKWGSPGSGDGQFDSLNGIAVGPNGDVYAVDRLGYRVHWFGYTTLVQSTTWGRLKSLYDPELR